jgi:hypothetical protein
MRGRRNEQWRQLPIVAGEPADYHASSPATARRRYARTQTTQESAEKMLMNVREIFL